MQRPLTPALSMIVLQVLDWPRESVVLVVSLAIASFQLYSNLQYTMYAKLLLKAIPSRFIPAVFYHSPKVGKR